MNEATWAIIGGLLTGVSLKLADYVFARMAARTLEASNMRKELRDDLKDCRAENDKLEKENDELRAVIIGLREENLSLKYPKG